MKEEFRTQKYAKYSMVCECQTTDPGSRNGSNPQLGSVEGGALIIPHFSVYLSNAANSEGLTTVEIATSKPKNQWNDGKSQNRCCS